MSSPIISSKRLLILCCISFVLLMLVGSSLTAQVYIPPPRVATQAAMSVHIPNTGLAPGTVYGPPPIPVIYDLPPDCGTTIMNGVVYNTCGGNYYRPYYNGPGVVYAPVGPPY